MVVEGDGIQREIVLENASALFVDDSALGGAKRGCDAVFGQEYGQLYELPVDLLDRLAGELFERVLE